MSIEREEVPGLGEHHMLIGNEPQAVAIEKDIGNRQSDKAGMRIGNVIPQWASVHSKGFR